ncbi:MAG: FecR domain-containing protein, partial [Proteobacteria bacterium]|nr:FecR domain-containing protein [Pseudomonadota bacterium]
MFRQHGGDLVLTGPDGKTVTVAGYFLQDPPPDLLLPGGGRLTPAMVDSFTPPEAAGQYAQAGQLAQAGEPIGQVRDITGNVFAVRADGTRVQLAAGDPVFQGDVVETAAGGAVNLIFIDATTFALGADARLALDEMVFNPATQQGSSSFSILKGVFVFVSGQIADTDSTKMTVTTPVATIGIRGTRVAGDVKPAGEESKFTVVDGEIAVSNSAGTVVMNDPYATTGVTSYDAPPSTPVILTQAEVNQSYGSVRSVSGNMLNSGPGNGNSNDSNDDGGGDSASASPPEAVIP